MIVKNKTVFRGIAGVLVLVTLLGLMVCFPTIKVNAAVQKNGIIDLFLKKDYSSPEARVADMELQLTKYGYELYADKVTGEIAFKDTRSGNILLSNPYDVSSAKSSQATKAKLLSQLIISFTGSGGTTTFLSAEEAADRGQITVNPIKSGIRVEYAIGRTEVRRLVPRIIRATRYETLIRPYITDERSGKRMDVFYSKYDPEKLDAGQLREVASIYPAVNKSAIYVFDELATERELTEIEQYIKTYCPHYSYEDMEDDHLDCQYEEDEKAPPLFKMAIEYYIEEDGLSVHLPANSIRFSEADYQLQSVTLLPYMGAGSSNNTGYSFVPDGSGALLRFEELKESGYGISGKIYGLDHTYNNPTGAHQEVMRMPVFGAIENQKYYIGYDKDGNIFVPDDVVVVETEEVETEEGETTAAVVEETEAPMTDESGNEIKAQTDFNGVPMDPNCTYELVNKTTGFVAIIESGEALTTLSFENGGLLHKYNSSYITIIPRSRDSYNLAESMSIGANAAWSVTANRKYIGTYKLKFMMLTSHEAAKANGISDYYETSYYGMADAYRDYLKRNGVIAEQPTKEKDDIPLYIEALGALEVSETFLSFPVQVKKPLTTFDDLKTVTEELAEKGVTNLHYRLTGFANDGLEATIPTSVKFEKVVGGDDGMIDFVEYAAEKGISVYPDFDFVYVYNNTGWFDDFNFRTDAIKAINGTYASKFDYDPAYQIFMRFDTNMIAPNVYSKYVDKFFKAAEKFGFSGVSVATLGSDVNTDFDKEDPLTREDSKSYTITALKRISEQYGNVMVDGGNAYAIPYADHVLNVSLDSSRYTKASNSVPFFGLVYHGYLNFAGTPTNMAGDIDRELLKIIENGASPYYTLATQNTALLKEYSHNYYSINYSIWAEDIVEQYHYLNEALKDVQDSEIVGHRFVNGTRIPSEQELASDKAQQEKAIEEISTADAIEAERLAKEQALAARREEEARRELEKANAGAADAAETEPETAPETAPETEPAVATGPIDYLEVEIPENIPVDVNGNPILTTEQKIALVFRQIQSKYDVTAGSIVEVTFANGVTFILNYNDFAVKTENGDILEAYAYLKNPR